MSQIRPPRVNWPALLLGMTMPGLGQMVNGEIVKGISFFAIYEMLAVIGLRCAVRLPDRLLMVGTGLTLLSVILFYLWTIRDAAVTRREGEPRPYNRWYFYLAAWLVGMVAVNGAVIAHIKSSTIEAFRIVAESMAPTVLRGDFVLTDKTPTGGGRRRWETW
ncbi:S26 family signal peptidase [Geotalea toluenoxydans]|uniref:S26 family signal peptidase n=1 Tax=Geotalea toluenoxydans TaxID=421624 RepID=UPI0006D2AD17|nr:S26 family signal peptidase [Geotalea toluenoxydans]